MRRKQNKNVLHLNNVEAKKYFLRNENYSNIDLPQYFVFSNLLKKIDANIAGKELKSLMSATIKPRDCECTNYRIINNKDGHYAWRPFQLINPVIYVDMINYITENDNWTELLTCFKSYQQNEKIECVSLPILPTKKGKKLKAEQIISWLENFEQYSLELAIDYSYCYATDITDCYGSIYTHSIAWAIMGKEKAKDKRQEQNLLGNKLDSYIQYMNFGQTNGIPQGSVLMDFIAEIVLGYADVKLTEKINQEIDEYFILRYRDDYRIFVNNPQNGEKIIKYLTEVLIELGLKLNSTKTVRSEDLIESAIKKDKFYWIEHEHKQVGNQKQLLLLYALSKKYPNSGTLKTQLIQFYRNLKIQNSDNISVLINIITEIAYNNPSTYPIAAAIISKLLPKLKYKKDKISYIDKIISKFEKKPNTGYLQIWLQRISYKIDENKEYSEKLCQLINQKASNIWDFSWIADKSLLKELKKITIVDLKILNTMDIEVKQEEVDLFKFVYT